MSSRRHPRHRIRLVLHGDHALVRAAGEAAGMTWRDDEPCDCRRAGKKAVGRLIGPAAVIAFHNGGRSGDGYRGVAPHAK